MRDRTQGRQEGTKILTVARLQGTSVDEDGIKMHMRKWSIYINLHHLNYVVALIISLALLVKLPKFFSQYIITRAIQLVGGATLNIICGAVARGTCML